VLVDGTSVNLQHEFGIDWLQQKISLRFRIIKIKKRQYGWVDAARRPGPAFKIESIIALRIEQKILNSFFSEATLDKSDVKKMSKLEKQSVGEMAKKKCVNHRYDYCPPDVDVKLRCKVVHVG